MAEDVRGVPAVLDPLQARELLRPEGRLHLGQALVPDEVEVGVPRRPRPHRRHERPRVVDVALVLGVVGRPHRQVVQVERGVPLAERRLLLVDAGQGPAQVDEDVLGQRRRRRLRVRDQGVDGLRGQPGEEVAAPVVVHAAGVPRVDQLLDRGVGHRLDEVHGRGAEGLHRGQQPGALVETAGPAEHDPDGRLPPGRLRDEVGRGRGHERDAGAERVGGVRHEVAPELDHLAGEVPGVEQHPAEHRRTDLVQAERELRDDAEVAAAPTQRPEQVGVLVPRGGDHLPVRGDDPRLEQVVAGQAAATLQPAAARAERQTGDTGARHPPTGHGQAVLLRGGVDLPPRRPAPDPEPPLVRPDLDVVHQPQVDADTPVDHGRARDTVPTAVHRHQGPRVDRRPDRGCHFLVRRGSQDAFRTPVDEAVEDTACVVVTGFARPQGGPGVGLGHDDPLVSPVHWLGPPLQTRPREPGNDPFGPVPPDLSGDGPPHAPRVPRRTGPRPGSGRPARTPPGRR